MTHIKFNQLNLETFVLQETSVIEHFQLKKMIIRYFDSFRFNKSPELFFYLFRLQKFIKNDFIYMIHTVLKLKVIKIQLSSYLLQLVLMKFVNIKFYLSLSLSLFPIFLFFLKNKSIELKNSKC